MIYLDYAAHTPMSEAVLDVFMHASREYTANPSSPHPPGQAAKSRLAEAARHIASLLDAKDAEIIFTSGASESNNLAIKGVAEHSKKFGKHIISTPLEHSSVNGPLAYLQQQGYEVDYAELLPDGSVDIGNIKTLLRPDTILVSVCWVDSEIGLVQPVREIAALLAERPHCVFHTDATQAVGKIPVCLEGVDIASFAPHKFFGPCGCGVLVRGEKVLLEPQIHGGISASPYRSGTPALELAVAAEKALELALDGIEAKLAIVRERSERLKAGLAANTRVRLNSTERSVPHIVNFSVPGVRTDAIQGMLSERGIAVSTRSACCAPGTVSRPVYALTHDRKVALSTMRVSLSHRTAAEDIDTFLKALNDCLDQYGEPR